MPASRARTAICSAPFEWPSRPGLPTRNFSRLPSRREAASTAARTSSRPVASLRAARPTPVGARYSPNTLRNAAPHSPVVTPALAQAIEAGMMFEPSAAARFKASSDFFTATLSRAALDRLQPFGVGIDESLLHVARLDRLHRAAHLLDLVEFVPRLGLELAD